MNARVLIRPKEGVLDPQGEAVRAALEKIGLPVGRASVGRLVELELPEAAEEEALRAEVTRVCEQLLANPLIETYEISVT
jgi:phosphoribosylformylglycinamidine synthase subunit PurS